MYRARGDERAREMERESERDSIDIRIEKNKDILIFYEKSSTKNKSIKQFFSKSKERVLLECYELDQGRKKIVLDGFIERHSLFFEKDILS